MSGIIGKLFGRSGNVKDSNEVKSNLKGSEDKHVKNIEGFSRLAQINPNYLEPAFSIPLNMQGNIKNAFRNGDIQFKCIDPESGTVSYMGSRVTKYERLVDNYVLNSSLERMADGSAAINNVMPHAPFSIKQVNIRLPDGVINTSHEGDEYIVGSDGKNYNINESGYELHDGVLRPAPFSFHISEPVRVNFLLNVLQLNRELSNNKASISNQERVNEIQKGNNVLTHALMLAEKGTELFGSSLVTDARNKQMIKDENGRLYDIASSGFDLQGTKLVPKADESNHYMNKLDKVERIDFILKYFLTPNAYSKFMSEIKISAPQVNDIKEDAIPSSRLEILTNKKDEIESKIKELIINFETVNSQIDGLQKKQTDKLQNTGHNDDSGNVLNSQQLEQSFREMIKNINGIR